jgi:hypothetical protein
MIAVFPKPYRDTADVLDACQAVKESHFEYQLVRCCCQFMERLASQPKRMK